METPFLSFSNPNYQFEDNKSKHKKMSATDCDVDVNIMTLSAEKQTSSKLSSRSLNFQNSMEDEEASVQSDEISSDEENDFVDTYTKLDDNDDDESEKLDNTENTNTNYGEKPKGILAYISLLEQSARERSEKRKNKDSELDAFVDESDSGQTTPSLTDHLKKKTFANVGFEINSPDSNDSGIQSDARSDDGISHTNGGSVSEDLCAITNKSYQPNKDGDEDSDEITPTQTDEANKEQPEVLPPGWERCEDEDGPYYWHIKSGTIQREPPSPAPPDLRETLRQISINSDSSNVSGDSIPSTPSSLTSSEDHLQEFEDHALQYAVKSLKNLSSLQRTSRSGLGEGSDKPVRYCVSSLGWVPIAEEDLTPERSNKAVNKCILDLTLGRNDVNDVVGRWGEGKELYMDLDTDSLRLIDPQDFSVLNYQPIHTIRVWGVGRENGRDFAYVARDKLTNNHMCHVFRCDTPARHIANTLRDICKKIMMERTLQQNALNHFAYVARDKLTNNHMCHVFRCDTPARHIANTLRDICKKIMMERTLQQNALNRLTRPTDLPNLDTATTQPSGEKVTFQSLYSNASFPTPMEEPKKTIRCHYLGSELVNKPTGMEVLNNAIDRMSQKIPAEKWQYVGVAVAPSTITITEHGNPDNKIEECRVRYLSFMGISINNVKMCAFIVHKAEDKFYAHVFHCDPTAGPLCKTIEAACKLRYQKCLDAQHRYAGKQREKKNKSVDSADDEAATPTNDSSTFVNLASVQQEIKHGYQKGMKAGIKSVMTSLKSPTIIQKIFTDRVCTGDKED